MGVTAAAILTVVTLAGVQPFDSPALAQGRPQSAPAQPASPIGLILGCVVDAASGRRIARAIVSLGCGPVVAAGVGAARLPRALTGAHGILQAADHTDHMD